MGELSPRLCNASHRRALRLQFGTISWQEGKEAVGNFAGRVRASALMLPNTGSDEIMLDRFVQSLPAHLRNLALLIPGTFDEVTARISMMALTRASESDRTRFRQERILQTSEGSADGDRRAVAPNGEQTRGGPSGDWIETAKCYRCGVKGHLAADCPEKPSRMQDKEPSPTGKGRANALRREAQLPHCN